jgi:hypothetical protein
MSETAETAAIVASAGEQPSPQTPAGVDMVQQFVAPLATVSGLEVAEHAAVYKTVHAKLQDALAEIDGR